MKRTNLVLDEKILEEATRLSGEKTYSGAVQKVLEEYVRRRTALEALRQLAGVGWDGDLAEMRDDKPRRGRRR